jgi:hypothetical protein
MTTPSTLPAIGPTSFTAFIPAANTPLIDKIHGLFGWTMACFFAGAACCIHDLYQAYQFSTHTAFGLNDQFKLVKCRALLLEADEKQATENIQPLLQQCEALLTSITQKTLSDGKESLLAKLAQHYAKTDPEHAYAIAQRLPLPLRLLNPVKSIQRLFDVAQSIQKQHPDFDKIKLDFLYLRALDVAFENPSLMNWVDWSPILVKACHRVQARNLCVKRAHDLAHTDENPLALTVKKNPLDRLKPLDRMKALCKIAECSYEIHDQCRTKSSIDSAKELMDKMPKEDLIQAHLVLANAYLCVGNISEMDQELRDVEQLFKADLSLIHKNLSGFAKLINKINEKNMVESYFHNFKVEDMIEKALVHISSLARLDQAQQKAEAYLDLADLCQIELVKSSALKYINWDDVYNVIVSLPCDSEIEINSKIIAINSKIDLLSRLIHFYKNDLGVAQKILQELERLYDQYPVEANALMGFWNKAELGKKIVMLYNEVGLADESEQFFKKQISDIVDLKDTDASDSIIELAASNRITNLAHYGEDFSCSKEQKKAALEAAEKDLLPQVKSNNQRNFVLAHIAEGYLQVDSQKSLNILVDLEDRQAKNCKALAFVTAVATASMFFYPTVTPVLFLGAGVLRLYPSLISVVY